MATLGSRHSWLHSAALLLPSMCLPAQEPPDPLVEVPLVVDHAGSDAVGLALHEQVRIHADASPVLRLVEPSEVSPRLRVILASVDANSEEPAAQTAISISILYDADDLALNGYLITALVQVCGADRTAACALEIVDNVKRALATLRASWPELAEAL